jgi:hypothetical protein
MDLRWPASVNSTILTIFGGPGEGCRRIHGFTPPNVPQRQCDCRCAAADQKRPPRRGVRNGIFFPGQREHTNLPPIQFNRR